MKTLQINDHLTISQRSTRPKTLQHNSSQRNTRPKTLQHNSSQRNTRPKTLQHNSSLPIPVDLVIDIFSRLPAKSVARFRCVSKQWGSLLCRQDFTELFLTRSSSLPQLLFSCQDDNKLCVFSAHHVQDSSIRVTDHHMKFSFLPDAKMRGSLQGLVCFSYPRMFKGRRERMHIICNPSTGQSLTSLPKVKTTRSFGFFHGYFGYDPIENQYKVFSTTRFSNAISPRKFTVEHQVLTLGTKKQSWRTVDSSEKHYPLNDSGVCIDGVSYYVANVGVMEKDSWSWINMIACFDVRSEKFSYIKSGMGMDLTVESTLVNYMGKLGVLSSELQGFVSRSRVTKHTKSFEMWVLEDAEKLQWSHHVCKFPSMWKNMVGDARLYYVGAVGLNEVVLAPHSMLSGRFYVFYYNIEKKTIRKVEIQGLDSFKNDAKIYTSANHVEQVELMEMFRTYNLRACNKS